MVFRHTGERYQDQADKQLLAMGKTFDNRLDINSPTQDETTYTLLHQLAKWSREDWDDMLTVRAEQPGGMFVDWANFFSLVRGKTTLTTPQRVFRVHFLSPRATRINRILDECTTAVAAHASSNPTALP